MRKAKTRGAPSRKKRPASWPVLRSTVRPMCVATCPEEARQGSRIKTKRDCVQEKEEGPGEEKVMPRGSPNA